MPNLAFLLICTLDEVIKDLEHLYTFRKLHHRRITPDVSYHRNIPCECASIYAQRYLFISKRQPNYHDYRAPRYVTRLPR